MKTLRVLLAALLPLGCAGPSAGRRTAVRTAGQDYLAAVKIQDLLPPEKGARAPDLHIRRGVAFLQAGKVSKASHEFNSALRFDPQNAYYQFFNGLAYHLLADEGDSSMYEQAQIGYELALKFNGAFWLASQQLGRLHLSRKQFAKAQEAFAQALLQKPDDSDLLHGLAQASYQAGDFQAALGAVRRARELDPASASILATEALILAAGGRSEEAKRVLADYRRAEGGQTRVARLEEQLKDWEQVRDALNDAPEGGQAEGSAPPAPAAVKHGGEPPPYEPEKMVVIDVVMIRTEEMETTNKGVNVLDGLSFQFSGNKTVTETSDSNANPSLAVSRVITSKFEIPEIKYTLNFLNTGDDRNEIIARPTLIAMDGKKSEFFSGSSLDVAIKGNMTATSKTIDAGVSLSVTPAFRPDGQIELDVTAQRSFFETTAAGSFQESVRTSKNNVTANVVMRFNQTLVLNGLREKQTTETKTGVPILRDIPFLQYFFSNEKTLDFHKSILVLMTPRYVEVGVETSDTRLSYDQRVGDTLKIYRERYPDLLNFNVNTMRTLGHLRGHRVFEGLQKSGTFDTNWFGDREKLGLIIRRTLSFLYY